MSGNVIIIGSPEFEADLEQFRNTISSVESRKSDIEDLFGQMMALLSGLFDSWTGPAGIGLQFNLPPLQDAGKNAVNVIGDTITAMKTTLHNYELAETVNTKNLPH
jgi:uncharacterized protein YukE